MSNEGLPIANSRPAEVRSAQAGPIGTAQPLSGTIPEPTLAGKVCAVTKGYYQLIEGHDGGFMFVLRAGNHDTILQSRVFWSRQAALDAVATVRVLSQDLNRYSRRESSAGLHYFELQDAEGRPLGRSIGCTTRAGLMAGIASVRRNAPATTFRGLVRRSLSFE